MTIAMAPADIQRASALVARHLGQLFEPERFQVLAGVLRRRLEARDCANPAAYLALLARGDREEWRVLACQLTVTETYFFRAWDQFRVLVEMVLPERLRARARGAPLRLLSAGCASGEEPYSLAILLREHFPHLTAADVNIQGIDVNPEMLARARQGRYHAWSLRDTPPDFLGRYFRTDGQQSVLDAGIRSMVSFEECNLVTGELPAAAQDVILCRNVIMYLSPEAVQAVVGRLTRALAPGGYLFLGYAETLRGLSHDFHLRHSDGTFYYQKRAEAKAGARPPVESEPQSAAARLSDLPETAWVDAVNRASVHIRRLSDTLGGPGATEGEQRPGPAESASSFQRQVSMAFELLRQDRFREALEVLDGLPPEAGNDPDAQLLRAGLLANCGDLEAAETVCRRLLVADDLNPAAHYLMALCRERSGDAASAMDHDRAAIYLDAQFAMPHLHVGRMAKRLADFGTARRELECAGLLLQREDPWRILLFGGGFSRAALLAFSHAELRACGAGS